MVEDARTNRRTFRSGFVGGAGGAQWKLLSADEAAAGQQGVTPITTMSATSNRRYAQIVITDCPADLVRLFEPGG